MKLCKDCAHFQVPAVAPEVQGLDVWARCNRPGPWRTNNDLVLGPAPISLVQCSWEREPGWIQARLTTACGKEGRFWADRYAGIRGLVSSGAVSPSLGREMARAKDMPQAVGMVADACRAEIAKRRPACIIGPRAEVEL